MLSASVRKSCPRSLGSQNQKVKAPIVVQMPLKPIHDGLSFLDRRVAIDDVDAV
jgi:hypothetical protein